MLYLLANEKVLVYHCLLVVTALLFLFQQNQNPVSQALLNILHSYQSLHRDQSDWEILSRPGRDQILNCLLARSLQRVASSKSRYYKALVGNSLKNNEPIPLGKETILSAESCT